MRRGPWEGDWGVGAQAHTGSHRLTQAHTGSHRLTQAHTESHKLVPTRNKEGAVPCSQITHTWAVTLYAVRSRSSACKKDCEEGRPIMKNRAEVRL